MLLMEDLFHAHWSKNQSKKKKELQKSSHTDKRTIFQKKAAVRHIQLKEVKRKCTSLSGLRCCLYVLYAHSRDQKHPVVIQLLMFLTTTLILCSSFRTKSTFFCVVSEASTALWLLQASLALSYESFAVMNFRQEFPTRCQLSPHTFSDGDQEVGADSQWRTLGGIFISIHFNAQKQQWFVSFL